MRSDVEFGDGERRRRADAAAVSAAELAETGATAADDDGEATSTRTFIRTPGTCTSGTFDTPGTQGTSGTR